ncbi:ribonuclease P protein component [bacterium]|nr:MAG: ribonuclease P protein component [bacterium]
MSRSTLKRNSQFRLVYSKGAKVAGKEVVIYFLRNDGDKVLPGYVASRKIGKAVYRSRSKRIMREAFRRLSPRIKEKGLWIVFVAAFQPKGKTLKEVLEDIEGSMSTAGLIS